MISRRVLAAVLMGFCLGGTAPAAAGATLVVANRAAREVRFTLTPAPGKAQPYTVRPGDLAAVPVTGDVAIAFDAGKARRQYQLRANAAYYFADFPGGLDLQELGLTGGRERPREAPAERPPEAPGKQAANAAPARPRVLTVKILVDQKEPATRQVWEKRLRARIAAASEVLEHHCRVQLRVVAVAEWQSDDTEIELTRLLRDFERKVPAAPAQIAIGFTSQRLREGHEGRIGATRTALRDHILVREWWSARERGRLEVLLHELGHYLGAAHSAEADSVMRSDLGTGALIRDDRSPRFDPVSTLIMNLVAEEVFEGGVTHLSKLSPATRDRLREVYGELAQTLRNDPTPAVYLRLLGPPRP
jgi:hypothetical protein